MATPLKVSEKKEEKDVRIERSETASREASSRLPMSRQEIAGTLSEGQEQGLETGEVSEKISRSKERKGGGAKPAKGQKAFSFTFDEKNLPPAPVMIQNIEHALREEIHKLEKKAKTYQGSLFRKADYPKYSETMIEIRKKHVLLRRLVTMAIDALKKLFLQMFGRAES